MTRAREIAQQAVENVWLTLAQRVVTLFLVPLIGAAALAYVGLFARMTIAEAAVVTLKDRATALETAAASLRADLTIHNGNVTRLQAQREGDAAIGRRIDDLREDVQRVNNRLDQMMTPPRRMVP
ncbi:hypothetical protein [Roseococcus sp.]|uniref:hypothetical protein n=1 Tax=Roseococcus sp. TaxID=2109646 RepID=UPI003BA89DCB